MATSAEPVPTGFGTNESTTVLAEQWRTLRRAATGVAVLTSPVAFFWLNQYHGWSPMWAFLATLALVGAFRGMVDLATKRFIPWPSLFGSDSQQLREEDVVARRRVWFWRFWLRTTIVAAVLAIPVIALWGPAATATLVQMLPLLVMLPLFLIFNFVILFGPLLLMNLSQIQ